jgi:hypothetical protein
VTIWAGGFWNQVSADEYPDRKIHLRVGDSLRVLGNFEIHTATFPKKSAAKGSSSTRRRSSRRPRTS